MTPGPGAMLDSPGSRGRREIAEVGVNRIAYRTGSDGTTDWTLALYAYGRLTRALLVRWARGPGVLDGGAHIRHAERLH